MVIWWSELMTWWSELVIWWTDDLYDKPFRFCISAQLQLCWNPKMWIWKPKIYDAVSVYVWRRVRSRGNYHSAMVKIEKSNFSYFDIFSLFLHKCHLLQVEEWNLHQNQNLMDTFMVYHACISSNHWKNQFCHSTYGQLEEWICIKNKDIKNPKT